MANVHGVAGEWARVKGTIVGLWPLFLSVFFLGFFIAGAFFCSSLLFLAFLLVLIASAWSTYLGFKRIERYFIGARGEERVASILSELPSSYHVFNDFVACGKHVDHVVVGPAGVFSVETKFWRGRVTVEDGHILLDGQLPDHSPLKQALHEASLVKSELAQLGWKGDVTPVLTFASNTFEAILAEVHGAIVLNANNLKSTFEKGRAVVDPLELERLVTLMENPS